MFDEYASEFPYTSCAISLATYLIKKQTESIKSISDTDEKYKLNKVNIALNAILTASSLAALPYFTTKFSGMSELSKGYHGNDSADSFIKHCNVLMGAAGSFLGIAACTEGIGHALEHMGLGTFLGGQTIENNPNPEYIQ
ncbi:hypothetical protein phytr_1280 [Candidatus Phycorickettsia trachydisci]|uniref:Uncharacterized protein n=1 Tax=Candidatus Phycorickettsia trachydisci TaxID=2115978 RepID=A0A2P1P748_9RICK|nr:hypothetical protein [Candidatus Phycorickettsia trachydisci]AVP87088.1 hypothetical protein phytr_1280 [Candidatus Phycorickettsia trachydisci]